MNLWICLLVFSFAPYAISEEGSLLQPCGVKDIECLSRSTEQFLEKTCKGIPNYDIKPIDPLIIPSFTYEVDKDMGLVLHFTSLNITGLRNQKISDFQMDLEKKSVLLKTEADLNIVGDVIINLVNESKNFSGIYYADSKILGTARYNYELKTDDKGVEHYEVGPETITCEVKEEPKVTLNKELQDNLLNDPAAAAKKPAYSANQVNLRKQTICKIVELAYIDVVHNIRASAKILPKSAFFKDV